MSSTSAAAEATRPHRHYRVLCISSIHPKASDETVKDILFRYFRKFGDVTVKIVNEPDERVAYVYFQSYEDARSAKHSSKSRVLIYDKPVVVEKAYEASTSYKNSSSSNYDKPRRSEPDYHPRNRTPPPPPFYNDRFHFHARHSAGIRRPYRPYFYPRNGPPGPHPHMYTSPRFPFPPPIRPYYGAASSTAAGFENRSRFKYPSYLDHMSPEDDPLATRTLFVGNLDRSINADEIRRIFAQYGTLEDIDIKYHPLGTGNAFAFVRFANLDMAARAKTELSGQVIGKFQCKIGYGKVAPTTKIWIGGLGHWTSLDSLEREFDRFGVIKKIEWDKGDTQAIITYENVAAALTAVKDMRGYPLGGPDKRIRTDFAGVEEIVGYANSESHDDDEPSSREPGGKYGRGRRSSSGSDNVSMSAGNEQAVASSTHSRACSSDPERHNMNTISETQMMNDVWHGALLLKNTSFAVKLHKSAGELEAIDGLMADETGEKQLIFNRKLRLNKSNLDKMDTIIRSKGNSIGIFLATPSNKIESQEDDTTTSGQLKDLVMYFKEKEAAGIIDFKNLKLHRRVNLYAFPPSHFKYELFEKSMPGFVEPNEDHLIIVAVSEYWNGKD